MVNQQAIYLSEWRVSHEHIDQDKPKETLLRRLLLSVEEGKQEQPTTIAMLQTRSILRQKASLYEKLQERRNGGEEKKEDYRLFYWSQRSDRTRRIPSVEASRYLCIGKIVASKNR